MKIVAVIIFFANFSMGVEARTVTIAYEAQITEISSRLLGGPLNLGDKITGTYMVNSDVAAANIQRWGINDEWSQTFFEGALQSSSSRIGTEIFQFENGFVRTDPNTPEKTAYSIYTRGVASSASTKIINGLCVNGIAIAFSPYPISFPIDYLPLDLPPFSERENPANFFIFFGSLGNDIVVGNLTAASYSSSVVPEPSSALMIFLGATLLISFSNIYSASATRNLSSSSDV